MLQEAVFRVPSRQRLGELLQLGSGEFPAFAVEEKIDHRFDSPILKLITFDLRDTTLDA